jgi:hypothetical protein
MLAANASQAVVGKDSTAPARSVVSRTTTPRRVTPCPPTPDAAEATSTQFPPLLPLYVLLRHGALPTSTQLVPLLPL